MITPAYCRQLARYNAWQNRQLTEVLASVPAADLEADLGAFFGSIRATLNHILWADQIWMSRLDAAFDAPGGGIAESQVMCPDFASWQAARADMDQRLIEWSEALTSKALEGDLSWTSAALGRDFTTPRALCVTHMFNHATHHRGQVHAMMTRTGLPAPVSDLIFMPEDV